MAKRPRIPLPEKVDLILDGGHLIAMSNADECVHSSSNDNWSDLRFISIKNEVLITGAAGNLGTILARHLLLKAATNSD